MAVDHHLVALVSLAGILLSSMGGLYLAYDLLGGESGPLRVVTRVVTYSVVFGVVFLVVLGPRFGIVAGAGFGLILGAEYHHARVAGPSRTGWRPRVAYAVLRGLVLALAGLLLVRPAFALVFGLLATAGLVVVYELHMAPTDTYPELDRFSLRPRVVLAGAVRGLAIGLAALIAELLAGAEPGTAELFALKIWLAVTLLGVAVPSATPAVERWAAGLPPRSLGAVGVALIVAGLVVESFQYVLVLFDVPVR